MRYDTVIDPAVIDNSHSQLIRMIPKGAKILDVGCASGILGEYMVNVLGCDVVGLDFDSTALVIAKQRACYRKLIQVDLESFSASILREDDCFDAIVFGDVLEHLRAPAALLRELSSVLGSEGSFLISLPNVAHGSIKLNLLLNRFLYSEEGLLDRTHLRFFSLATILEFCDQNRFRIGSFSRVFAPIYGMEQKVPVEEIPDAVLYMVEDSPESWVYQYVFSLKPAYEDVSVANESMVKLAPDEISRFEKVRKRNALIEKHCFNFLLKRRVMSG